MLRMYIFIGIKHINKKGTFNNQNMHCIVQTLINQKYTEIEKHIHIQSILIYTERRTHYSLFNHRFSIDFII